MMLIVLSALVGAAGGFLVLPSETLALSLVFALVGSNLMGLAAACVIAMRASPPVKASSAASFPAEYQPS